jgi:3-oxoacyl-[acyl-carrier protein] reductase
VSRRVALVTGAASGIGKRLVTALASRGDRVLAADIDEAGLGEASGSERWPRGDVIVQKLDVTKPDDWERALDRLASDLGRLDLLLNVGGALRPARVVDVTDRDVDLHFDVNVKGTVYGTRAGARRMVATGGGHIVNIGSLASLAPVPGLSLYSASKFAVRGFTLAAAIELGELGVAVSLVMPDAVDTPMLDLQVDYEEAALTFSGSKPLTVEDVERVILDTVLVKRPLEVTIPLGRGVLARAANAAPGMSRALLPILRRRGLAAQTRKRSAS